MPQLFLIKPGKNLKKVKKVKHKSFYIYQVADIIFTSSCRAVGMLFAWMMIESYSLKVELGWFITASWTVQVVGLLAFSSLSERFNKKLILLFCSFTGCVSLGILIFDPSIALFKLGAIYILTSLLSIIIQPIGSSIVPTLYNSNTLERAFRIRGFVNSINTVLGAIMSGFIIKLFSPTDTLFILCALSGVSFILFLTIKIGKSKTADTKVSITSAPSALIKNKVERTFVIISALSNFIMIPILIYIAPILVIEVYGLSALEVGLSETAFGVGMIFGSLFLCRKLNRVIGIRYTTVSSLGLVAIGLLVIFTLNNIWSLYSGLAFSGLGVVMYNINTSKIRCSATPASLRNSFESIFLAVCIIIIPAGIAFSTLMVNISSSDLMMAIFAISMFTFSIVIFLSKDFKHIASLDDESLDSYYVVLFPEAYNEKFHKVGTS